MSIFVSKSQATELFSELFTILLAEQQFSDSLRTNNLKVLIIHTDPDFSLFLEPDGLHLDGSPSAPVITIKMSCDTAHQLWSGSLLLPIALATGRLRVRGNMAKILEFAPMLQPAFARYPELVTAAGLRA